MGTGQSRYGDDQDERRENEMRRHADYAQNLAYRTDRFGTFPLLLDDQNRPNQSQNNNNRNQIEIDGTIYDIDQFINEGGFGKIFKARSRQTNQLAAIKVMPNTPEIKQEIETEIRFLNLTKSIQMKNHPVIECFGSQVNHDKIYIAMELAQADLLTFWFDQIKQTSPEDRFAFGLTVIIYVLRALIFLEKLNIIHGDIKPQNLVIVKGRNQPFCIKLIDFGTVEKMFTKRNQLTVDVAKAHTIFFASPEFLKRDANNLMKRRLHKKSDAWAAGVMFYILFFEKLPWKDQYDYENFCNDPKARDIRVPREGGYQLIVELLLKKDPKERASAKSTFMQIKSHPIMGKVVQNIQQMFYPADDVLNIVVSDNVRQQLAQFGKHSSSSTQGEPRRPCRYGRDCYRRDADHRQEFIHVGDPDFNPALSIQSQKKPCRYGTQCYRLDPEHRQKYLHPDENNSISSKKACRHGSTCSDHSFDHRHKYLHLDQNNSTSFKTACRYGTGCTDHNPDHRQKFQHPTDTHSTREKCRFLPNCTKRDDREHMKKFSHN